MGTQQVVCEKDNVPTRLRCARCETAICPTCLVRTPVGYKCAACAGEQGAGRRRGRSAAVPLAVGGVVVLVALGVVLNLGRSSSPKPPPPVADPVATQGVLTGAQPPSREAMIGEEARDGQLVFVVSDFSCEAKAPEGKLCQLRATVKNVSSSPAMFLSRFQYLVDAQGKTYGADDDLTRAVPDNGDRSLTELNVNPDVVVPFVLVFDVPEPVQPTEAQFKGTGSSRLGIRVLMAHRS